jgi:uncharacterized protein (DUF1501 family)
MPKITRRSFLGHSACAAVGMTSLASTVFDLRRVAAAACSPAGDYRALVCVFLYGGNDGNNVLVPTDTTDYNLYAAARGSLALNKGSLLPITPTTGDGRTWGLHPNLPKLQARFQNQQAALIANVGPLVAPVLKTDYDAGTAALPPQLFSHSDQTLHWQTGIPDQAPRTGWGGRIADMVECMNGAHTISMSISLDGTNTFQVGNQITQYQVSTGGTIDLNGYYRPTDAWSAGQPPSIAVRTLLQKSYGNLFQGAYAGIVQRALDNNAILGNALDTEATTPLATVFPANSYLSDELKMIARLIHVRGTLGLNRQVFFCSAGGYDTHSGQLQPHADLLTELDGSLDAFYNALTEMGLQNNVTVFTASDFGRTLLSNADGSDHGWGNHHFVLGGGVKGKQIYGTMPNFSLDGPNDSGDGRWIPTTSVDEYAATLAKWFGVSSTDMATVFPNLGRFNTADMGFMG